MKIEFIQTGGPYGDATSSYDVIIPEGTMVDDFVTYIAYNYSFTNNEWGGIYLSYNDKPGFVNRVPLINYNKGSARCIPGCNADILNRLSRKIITKVEAHGGWSRMDYVIYVD